MKKIQQNMKNSQECSIILHYIDSQQTQISFSATRKISKLFHFITICREAIQHAEIIKKELEVKGISTFLCAVVLC